jgi:hypothetical protein
VSDNNIEAVDDLNPPDPGRPGMGISEEAPALRPRRRFPTQVLVLLLIVGVSAAALYAMRRYGMRAGFQFDTVNTDFKDNDSEKAKTYERIMADLASVQKPLDVALGDFGKSPFMRENSTKITPDIPQLPIAQSDDERHKQEASAAVKALHLNGIIGNIARIDEQNVKVGDTVSSILTVKAIDGRSVTFEAYGDEYTMTMEVGKPQGAKSAAKMRPSDKR